MMASPTRVISSSGASNQNNSVDEEQFDDIMTNRIGGEQAKCIINENEDEYYTLQEIEDNNKRYKDEVIHSTSAITHYQLGDIIGRGCFGQVFRGFDLDTGCIMAIKQVPILKFINKSKKDIRLQALEKEIELLSTLSHENIVKYLGKHNDGKFLNIFLEYVSGGSINVLLSKYGRFNETLVRIYVKHILQGLDYLHAHNVVHRDIKGANVLVDNHGVCKLADFGGSKRLVDQKIDTDSSMIGTAQWMAPEVIKNKTHGRYSDIWSVGCTVIEMAQGRPPWSDCENSYAVLFKIAKSNRPPYPDNLSSKAVDFLNQCFQIDPKKRPNAHKLLQHPFITGEDIVSPLQSEYYGVGLISDSFKSFFEKFVESGFSEKSRSLASLHDLAAPQLRNSAAGHQESPGLADGAQAGEPRLRAGKSHAGGQLKHLSSYASLSSSAPVAGYLGHRASDEDEEQLFDNAEGVPALEDSIPVRVIVGGRLQHK